MTGTTRSSDGLDARRRKLLFRSWHRGIREMDLVLGGFADGAIHSLTETELDQYESLLEAQDADLLMWIISGRRPPEELDLPVLRLIQASRRT